MRVSEVRVSRGGGIGIQGEQEKKIIEWGRGCHCQGPTRVGAKEKFREARKGYFCTGRDGQRWMTQAGVELPLDSHRLTNILWVGDDLVTPSLHSTLSLPPILLLPIMDLVASIRKEGSR
jgi:hypothetical protein